MKKLISWSIVTVLTIVIIASFSFAGCKKEVTSEGTTEEVVAEEEVAEEAEEEETKKEVVIMMMPKTIDNPVFAIAGRGCEAAAEELGFKIIWTGPTADDPALQSKFIEDMVVKKVDGIGLSVNDAEAITPAINEAVKAGIKVICWDSDAAGSDRILYYGSNNYQGGIEMAKLLVDGMGTEGKIAIWNVQIGAANLQDRYDGAKDKLEEIAPNIEIVDIVTGGGMEIGKSVQAFEDYTKSHPEISGWIAVDGFPFFGTTDTMPTVAEKAKAGGLTIVTFDSIEPQQVYIEEGIVYGLVGQRYFDWGYEGSKILYDLITNPDAKYNEIVDAGLDIITKEGGEGRYSIEEYKEFWKTITQ